MALVLANKPGTITVVNVPDLKGVGILQVSGMPNNSAIITQSFNLKVAARASVDYSISNTKYIYVYGTSLTELGIQFLLFPSYECNTARSIFSFLSFLDGRLVSAYGTPRINVAIDGVVWRGVVLGATVETGRLPQSPEIAIGTINAVGNFL